MLNSHDLLALLRKAPGRPQAVVVDRPQVPFYRVGEHLISGRTRWPEGAQYSFGPEGHELTLFTTCITPQLIDDVRRAEVEFALTVAGPVLKFAYRFGDTAEWTEVPYVWHLQHQASRAVPGLDHSAESRALLWISLVGTDDGVIHAQRGVTLGPEFTHTLHSAIRTQAQTLFDPLECILAASESRLETAGGGLPWERASAWTMGNS